MIPRIKKIVAEDDLKLLVTFDNDEQVLYDMRDDINNISDFRPLETEIGLFKNFQLDPSRTCVYWSDRIDLPSDTILEYGKKIIIS
jgi:hypothetical protein